MDKNGQNGLLIKLHLQMKITHAIQILYPNLFLFLLLFMAHKCLLHKLISVYEYTHKIIGFFIQISVEIFMISSFISATVKFFQLEFPPIEPHVNDNVSSIYFPISFRQTNFDYSSEYTFFLIKFFQ